MLDFAVKLTHTPEACEEADVARLREAGFSDTGILRLFAGARGRAPAIRPPLRPAEAAEERRQL